MRHGGRWFQPQHAVTARHADAIIPSRRYAPRSASAIASTAVEIVPITEKQFLYLVDETPFFALKVMRVLAGRLRSQSTRAA